MQLVNEKLVGVFHKYRVNAEAYFILLSFFNNRDAAILYLDYFINTQQICESLLGAGYLSFYKQEKGFQASNIGLTELGKRFVKECLSALGQRAEVTSVDEWIDEYREIFAPAKFSGGRPIRGDRRDCIKKMIKFMLEFESYDKEIILRAARNYMKRMSYEGYKFVSSADYWINKNGASGLSAECELIVAGKEVIGSENTIAKTQVGGKNF